MSTTTATAGNPSGTAPGTAGLRPPTRRIVDAPTRMAHALIAISFLGAWLTAEGEHWRAVHVTLGYVLAGVLAFRVVYGLVGPRQARVALWFRKLAAAPRWLGGAATALRAARPADVPWQQGRNLLMAALIVALVLLMPPLLLSGLAPHLAWVTGGPADALSELHEALGEGLLLLALAHVGLVLAASLLRRQNLARPMLDGRLPGSGPDLARRNHGLIAAHLLAAALGVVAWQWHATPHGLLPTATPAASMDHDDDED
ncbi:MAG: cytochrome b/b6 domain-containing protein [Betaproteobacteria bacterium]